MATVRKGKRRSQILLVDDHPMVRERLAEIINREADLYVCGEAEDRHNNQTASLSSCHIPALS